MKTCKTSFAAMLVLVVTAPALAQSSSGPASEAASEPALLPAASMPYTAPDTSPLPKFTRLSDGLKLDWAEKQLLDAVHDNDGTLTENGLYVLLRRAAALPELNQKQYEALNQISTESLLESPKRFRALPMRLTMNVYRVRKWTPVQDFHVNSRWPKDMPVWWIGGLDFTGRSPSRKPTIVLSIVDPTPFLGESKPGPAEGELLYPDGRHLEVAGLFYKVFQEKSLGSDNRPPTLADYPVVVSWQVGKSNRLSDNFPWMSSAAIVSLVVLAFLFFFFRRRVGQMKKDSPTVGRGKYRPLRESEAAAPPAPEPDGDGEVDQALRDAAERFRKDKDKPNG